VRDLYRAEAELRALGLVILLVDVAASAAAGPPLTASRDDQRRSAVYFVRYIWTRVLSLVAVSLMDGRDDDRMTTV